ncbi:hypothetical protein PUN28_018675 [Cardiocondyla obscurior]|uniref:Uncharacterized protein n=1 Tax=Cardiocondyla obscurior TaxID=286306 RepID=A0AAW2EF23_9HYME
MEILCCETRCIALAFDDFIKSALRAPARWTEPMLRNESPKILLLASASRMRASGSAEQIVAFNRVDHIWERHVKSRECINEQSQFLWDQGVSARHLEHGSSLGDLQHPDENREGSRKFTAAYRDEIHGEAKIEAPAFTTVQVSSPPI